MKVKYIVLALALLAGSANAQQTLTTNTNIIPGLPNLKVGDRLPDLAVGKLINAGKEKARTADYQDRLLIVDFWATGCPGCVAALPKMDALQKQFGAKIRILPVTFEKEAPVLLFWRNNKYTKKISLPSVVEDRIFESYFRHRMIPHEVWIYKGTVVAITEPEYVDAGNIQKVLSGQPVNWPVKDDFYVFDRTKPLFSPDSNQVDVQHTPMKYAAISDYKNGAPLINQVQIVRDPVRKTLRCYLVNSSVFSTYVQEWSSLLRGTTLVKPTFNLDPNGIVWEVADPSRYKYDKKDGYKEDWMRKNAICYESLNPDTGQSDQEVHRSVIADLNRLLGLNVRWEKRKEKVLVLVRTTTADKLKSKRSLAGLGPYGDYFTHKGSLYQWRDATLYALVSQMNNEASNPYVFDETNYKDNIDMDLTVPSWTDIAAIRKAIAPYGLDLKEEERAVDKFVFTEVDGGLLVDGPMQIAARARRDAQAGMAGPTEAVNQSLLTANKNRPGVVTLPSGLQYKVIKQGNGVKAGLNDKVSVHYAGMLANGKIFDSSYEKGRPSLLAVKSVIQGWQEALQLMPAGSKWELWVPAELAYGAHTGQGQFPANSNMIFELELLNVIKQ